MKGNAHQHNQTVGQNEALGEDLKAGWQRMGCLLTLLSVILGAFGAHALSKYLSPEALDWWKTAHEYHVFGSFSLLLCTHMLPSSGPSCATVFRLLFVGTIVFAGSLYLLAITGYRPLGAITPIGGACLIVGWALVAREVGRIKRGSHATR